MQTTTPIANKNAGTNSGMITGLFRSREDVDRAYRSLESRGYSRDDLNLVMSDDVRKRYFDDNTDVGSKALEGAGVGAGVGGTVGAVVAAIAAIGTSLAIPGLGLVIAGPLAAAFAGAGAGGLAGGLVGSLVGSGIPEERAKVYEQGLREGGVLMGVRPRTDADAAYFESEWRNARGEHIYR